MNKAKKRYDSKYKVTRINLSDYLALKRMSLVAGVSMSEALHRLIEHQAQLPLLDMAAQPMSAIATQPGLSVITAKPMPAFRSAPVAAIATNGSKGAAFRIKPKGARYD
ncbi:hypothetical protein ES703_75652 [subsurface metagenome]